mmetsp:Transcript_344/g.469  ORF Transcript_344/g.469 Transcript_344/m.469 type:complete len:92 (-) Transcript_344:22-297(-)|eukprot:CAMPEP_0175103538 /NCGR_PEP_ID=MMETSP0086_2-20121207/9150_1 /TAXON_ID=136419 /ORGANISM="Unknown Unknown, Strain D1" /LENGTH=91 /DNA_ID=CAMNT_0016378675 /DNA_START=34 /DNA_END=309 /DNA_ORIENTATION=-
MPDPFSALLALAGLYRGLKKSGIEETRNRRNQIQEAIDEARDDYDNMPDKRKKAARACKAQIDELESALDSENWTEAFQILKTFRKPIIGH